jgi:CheY-like chemotaxis protein
MTDKPKTVLLVDDVQLFIKLEETFFKRAGCKVITATSGKDCLKAVREQNPDLILLDYLMPDLRGDQVCQELRKDERTKDVPVIIVSTSSKNEDIDLCYKAGCNDYLTKPVQPEIVLARAAALLAIPHRAHRRLPVNFRVDGEAPPLTFTGFSRNLSMSGISVEAEQVLEQSAKLRIWLPVLEDHSMVEVMGEVVRSEFDKKRGRNVYGIRFIDISKPAEDAITQFLKKHLPEQETLY